jgi:hypothetical protein
VSGAGDHGEVELELGTHHGWVAQDGRIHRCELGEIVIAFGPLAAQVEI